jgi:16S rRNA (guanine1207-N2)-methyltransferase
LLGSHEHLNKGGKLIFVIKKKFGEDSIKKQLSQIFEQVEILKRDSGYYVLMATK